MQKKVLSILVILIVLGGVAFFSTKNNPAPYERVEQKDTIVPEVSEKIIWNAYTLNDTAFIYPSDWIFEEIKNPADSKKIFGFKITPPNNTGEVNSISDTIEVGGACPKIDATVYSEFNSSCISNIWLHTESKNESVLKVFSDMRKFSEASKDDTTKIQQ